MILVVPKFTHIVSYDLQGTGDSPRRPLKLRTNSYVVEPISDQLSRITQLLSIYEPFHPSKRRWFHTFSTMDAVSTPLLLTSRSLATTTYGVFYMTSLICVAFWAMLTLQT